MLFGLTALVYLAHGPMDKALLMALFGALLASVGLDPVTGTPRFTFNFLVLRDGIGLTPVVIGLFGVSEVLLNLDAKAGEIFQNKVRGLLPTAQDWRDSAAPIARGSLLGFFIGAIPGIERRHRHLRFLRPGEKAVQAPGEVRPWRHRRRRRTGDGE